MYEHSTIARCGRLGIGRGDVKATALAWAEAGMGVVPIWGIEDGRVRLRSRRLRESRQTPGEDLGTARGHIRDDGIRASSPNGSARPSRSTSG